MKGVCIMGGKATRLGLYSRRVSSKSLVLIYNRLAFEYPLHTLVSAGITDITMVVGFRYSGDILSCIGDGAEFGCTSLNYVYQKEAKGISDAIYKAKESCKGSKIAVILGDNFFEDNVSEHVKNFDTGCRVFLKPVPDPERYGVAEVDAQGKVINIIEKPRDPKTNLAVTGLYLYDETVFDKIEQLKPSVRGELEVTDLNKAYINENKCTSSNLDGFWNDMGTFDSILETANFVKNNNFKLGYEIDAWKS